MKLLTPSGVVSTLPLNIGGGALSGVAIDVSGNIYTEILSTIFKTTPTGTTSIFAGDPLVEGTFLDGTGANARFLGVQNLMFDATGNLYVSDAGNSRIRKITPAGVVTTVAGSGIYGNKDGAALTAELEYPNGMVFDAVGNLFFTDTSTHTIRKLSK
jgi:hypothetical protein